VATPAKSSTPKITRITANDSGPKKSKKTVAPKRTRKVVSDDGDKPVRRTRNPFFAIWRYLKGSWYELRQVRWPDRRTTWAMTGALLLFTAFFVVVILLLDAGKSNRFNIILRK